MGSYKVAAEADEVWQEITRQWPLLLTGDTLLSIQALLRVAAFLSPVFRGDGTAVSGFCGLTLLGVLCRLGLHSLTKVYMLDGPLGGTLGLAFEVALIPLLTALSWRGFLKAPFAYAMVTVGALWVGRHHWLNLCGEAVCNGGDALFISAQCLEVLGAFVHLLHTASEGSKSTGSAAGVLHLLLPIQQGCAVYFFHEAFSYDKVLVGAGRPFTVLRVGSAVQLGFFLAAAALHLTDATEGGATGTPVGDRA